VGVGILVAACVDEFDEPLAVQLPRRVGSARDRAPVDDTEDFGDLLSPCSKLVRKNVLNMAEVWGGECNLERDWLGGAMACRHSRLSWPAAVSAR
jgi:hypothetical protein